MNKMFIPQVVSGYDLAPIKGYFSIVIPEYRENININPSFETNVLHYATSNCTISRSSTNQRRGFYSGKVTTSSNVSTLSLDVFSLTAGTMYVFSVDLYGNSGVEYRLCCTAPSGNKKYISFRSLRKWKRPFLVYSVDETGNHTFFVEVIGKNHSYYLDGVVVERGTYPTTYFDGDMTGYVVGERAYWWSGTPHASKSYRSVTTRSGGKEIYLRDKGLIVTSFTGLGMTPVNNIIKDLSTGGGFYNGTIPTSRTITIVGSIFGSSNSELNDKREALIDIIKYNYTPFAQELLIRYRPDDNDKFGEVYDIKASYSSGLEGNVTSNNQEVLTIQFIQSESFIQRDVSNAKPLAPGISYLPSSIVRVFSDSSISSISSMTGLAYSIIYDKYGNLYIGTDQNSLAGGVAINGIGYYDGSTWVSVGGGIDNGSVKHITLLPDGRIIISGDFTSIGSDATKGYCAIWDGSTWSAFGDPNAVVVKTIQIGTRIYVFGDFTNIGGSAISYIAYTTNYGSTFSAAGTVGGAISEATYYYISPTNYIFATVPTTGKLRMYNETTSTWSDYFTSTGGASYTYKVVAIGSIIYLLEDIYIGVGNETISIRRFTGSNTYDVFAVGSVIEGRMVDIFPLSDGRLIITYTSESPFMYINGNSYSLNLPYSGYIIYKHNRQFNYGDMFSDGAPTAMAESKINPLEITFANSSSMICSSTIVNGGDSITIPKIEIFGPANVYWIKNITNGQSIYFDNFYVEYGETVTGRFDQSKIRFHSNINGDVTGKVFGGVYPSLRLINGTNIINSMILGSKSLSGTFIYTVLQLLGTTFDNTNGGLLYSKFTVDFDGGGTTLNTLYLYSDAARTQLVAKTSSNEFDGVSSISLSEQNSSGIFGIVKCDHSHVETTSIIAVGVSNITWNESKFSIFGVE